MQISNYRIVLPQLDRERMRIVQISDTHFTSPVQKYLRTQEIMDTIRMLRPDVIAVTGDLISRESDEECLKIGEMLLSTLSSEAPVLYVYGNHETTLPEELRQMLTRNMEQTDVHLLNNASVTIGGVNFYGYVLPNTCYKNQNGTYFGLEQCSASRIGEVLGDCGSSPSVLLAHNPMGMPAYAQWGADVVLSGHVHGGIVRLPLIGGILSPERRFFPKYTKGCYRMERTTMVVSAGIGKLRLFNPAEIVCVELWKGQEEV